MHPLAISSLSFIGPLVLTTYNKQWYAAIVTMLILITSVSYHSTKDKTLMHIDIGACYILVTTYLAYAYKYKILYIGIPETLYVITIYHYGYRNQALAWSPNYYIATFWHGTIHVTVALTASYGSYLIGPI